MAIRRIVTLLLAGLFIFAAQGATDGFADGFVWAGLCQCNVSTPGFSCHFERWLEAPSRKDITAKCAGQSNNYGTLARLQEIERRKKKIHH